MAFESDNFMPNYQRLTILIPIIIFPVFSHGFLHSPNRFWPIIIVIEGNKNKWLYNFLISTSDNSKMDVGELEYRHKFLVPIKKKELCAF